MTITWKGIRRKYLPVTLLGIQNLDYKKKQIRVFSDTLETATKRLWISENEPDTIKWIESFGKSETLEDIGCNIGTISLITKTLHPETRIYAIDKNREYENTFYNNFTINNFTINTDFPNVKFIHEEVGKQKTIDQINQYHNIKPTKIKIDTDGAELEILQGAKKTLKGKQLTSILLENDKKKDTKSIDKIMKSAGFKHYKRINNNNNTIYWKNRKEAKKWHANTT